MMIETTFGTYQLLRNEREAFNKEQFEGRYIVECYDKYTYLVGDLSSGILRIRGFSQDAKSKNHFRYIPDYITESCVYNAQYFILKRIRNEQNKKEQ